LDHDFRVLEMSMGVFAVETLLVWVPFGCATDVEDFFPMRAFDVFFGWRCGMQVVA
jgi:hypothetical protein